MSNYDEYDDEDLYRNKVVFPVQPWMRPRPVPQQRAPIGPNAGGVTVVVPNQAAGAAAPGGGVIVHPQHQAPTAMVPMQQAQPMGYGMAFAPSWPPQPYPGGPAGYSYPAPPPWAYGYPPLSPWRTLKVIGSAVDVLGQLAAAFLIPIPAAPTATGEGGVDAENQVRFQAALAQHAKTDERIRTACKVVREALDATHSLVTAKG
jgi:hypothetical protein